jgi:hypothetical protein
VDGEWAERGEVTLTEAARILNLSLMRYFAGFGRVSFLPSGTVRARPCDQARGY